MLRRLVFALALALSPSLASAATVPQNASADTTTGTNPLTPTFTSGTAAGSMIAVCGIADTNATSVTIADDKSDTETTVIAFTTVGGTSTVFCGAFLKATTGAKIVTVTLGGVASTFWSVSTWEIAGLTNPIVDKTNFSSGNSGTASSGPTGTLSASNEALVSTAGIAGGAASGTSGWTFSVTSPSSLNGQEFETVTSNASQTATYPANTNPSTWAAVIASFASTASLSSFTLLGVGPAINNPVFPAGFHVATTGSDSNAGTLAAPFLTWGKCQTAMRNGSLKLCYIHHGTYTFSSELFLTASDNGETWQYYPADGVNSAVVDGGSTSSSTGIDILEADNTSGVTINGIKFQNPLDTAINVNNGNTNFTLENSDIGTNHATTEEGGFAPLVVMNGKNSLTDHNFFHDALAMCIELFAFNTGTSIDGSVVSNNVFDRCGTSVTDVGSIYTSMRNTNNSGGSPTIKNNWIWNYGGSGGNTARGIYLDDDSSNVVVSGNVVGPPNASAAANTNLLINGGDCNTISNNIFDVGRGSAETIEHWSDDSGNGGAIPFTWTCSNVSQNNIVTANYSGSTTTDFEANGKGYGQGSGYDSTKGTITNTAYKNYGGGDSTNLTKGPVVSDSNPQQEDPSLTLRTFKIGGGSAVFNSPVSFVDLTRGWGPPGFTLPTDGQTPSHCSSC